MLGQSGVGKSSFWAAGDKTFFVECEAGLNFLECFKMPCRNWQDFLEIGALLGKAAKDGEFPYDTVVVDTADRWIQSATQEVIDRGRAKFSKVEINGIGDIPNGAGWNWQTNLVSVYLQKLEQLPAAIVFVAHLNTKEVKTRTQAYHRETISIGGKTGETILAWADHTLFVEAEQRGDTIKRTVRTRPAQTREGKSREGAVPDGMIWADNTTENYDNLRKLFT